MQSLVSPGCGAATASLECVVLKPSPILSSRHDWLMAAQILCLLDSAQGPLKSAFVCTANVLSAAFAAHSRAEQPSMLRSQPVPGACEARAVWEGGQMCLSPAPVLEDSCRSNGRCSRGLRRLDLLLAQDPVKENFISYWPVAVEPMKDPAGAIEAQCPGLMQGRMKMQAPGA